MQIDVRPSVGPFVRPSVRPTARAHTPANENKTPPPPRKLHLALLTRPPCRSRTFVIKITLSRQAAGSAHAAIAIKRRNNGLLQIDAFAVF
jgi:hypothetical protein